MAELERLVANLKTELDAANRARIQLQSGLDEANSQIKKRQSQVERLSAELEKATNSAKDAEAPHQEGECLRSRQRVGSRNKSPVKPDGLECEIDLPLGQLPPRSSP